MGIRSHEQLVALVDRLNAIGMETADISGLEVAQVGVWVGGGPCGWVESRAQVPEGGSAAESGIGAAPAHVAGLGFGRWVGSGVGWGGPLE